MAFEYIDAKTGDIIDILKGRDARTVKNYFIANYLLKDLRSVETITIDMNAGYVNVIKEIFPQAKIIIDRFHLVQLISRSMNTTRVRIMNAFNTSNGETRRNIDVSKDIGDCYSKRKMIYPILNINSILCLGSDWKSILYKKC